MLLRQIFSGLLDIFFPRICPVTGKFPGKSPYRFLSEEGRNRLTFIGETCCPACGAPFSGLVTTLGECNFCRDHKFRFGRSRSLVVLDASARKIVHAGKYNALHAAFDDLAQLAAESEPFSRHLEGATLVPVPLFEKRESRRGYNQSRIFAEALARRIAGTHVESLLVRVRDTGTQTALSATERRGNVRHAFDVSPKQREKISAETRYVVIDDVFTTGSTLSECARALKKYGARKVDAATFAHG